MRLFVSINLPPDIQHNVVAIQQQINKSLLFKARYVLPEQLHCTLAFLGDVSDEKVPEIIAALKTISFDAFQVCTSQLGMLKDHHNNIRIIYLDLISSMLEPLAQNIAQKLNHLVALEQRPFLHHMTIARVKNVTAKQEAETFIANIVVPEECFTVNSFVLQQSILSDKGPVHQAIVLFNSVFLSNCSADS